MMLKFGILGVFALSILDSTFFVFLPPLIIDAVLILFISNHTSWMPFYSLSAMAGSLFGCTLDYMIIGKASEKTLKKLLPKGRLGQIQNKMKQNTFWALVIASILPPPFPFSPFIWV